jgi:two-component system, sensor histidine kinase PdtaS
MQALAAHPNLTICGLRGIGHIPYGIHMCHFYRERQDLVEALVPFFIAGLHSNECCTWITAEPLNRGEAKLELEKAGCDAEAAISSGALTIQDYAEFYLKARGMKSRQVAELWLAEEARALEQGYSGLRITGNASFVMPETWQDFMDYEEVVHQAFQGRRIVSLCSYDARRVAAAEVGGVMRRHTCALDRPDESWQIIDDHRLQPEPQPLWTGR